MTEETTTVDLVEPHLLRLSPPPSASSELSSPSGLPSCSSADPVTTPVSACDSTTTTTSSRLAEIQDALVEVESTPASALSPRDTSSSYNCPHYHLHHHHHHLPQRLSPPPPQQQGWSSPVTLESSAVGDGVVVVVNHALPLSPSMTPPILLSPTGGDDEEDEEVPSTHTTSSSDSVANSPLSFASEDEEEEEADVGVEGTMPSEDVPTFLQSTSSDSPHSPVQHQQQTTTTTTTPEKSPSPRLSRSRPGSLRHARSSARFKPYRTGATTVKCTTAVLRPLNDGGLCQRPCITTTTRTTASSSCDTATTRTEDATDEVVDSLESTTHSDTTNTSDSSTSGHHQHHQQQQTHQQTHHHQLTIDTALANSQSAAAHQQSRAAKLALVQKLITVIDDDDFERFRAILRQSKQPDLNVFVNGQTALHYALLRGRDVSWCKQLVLFGANPNLSNLDGWHPLHLASFSGLNENLNYLISCNTNNGPQVK